MTKTTKTLGVGAICEINTEGQITSICLTNTGPNSKLYWDGIRYTPYGPNDKITVEIKEPIIYLT